MSDNVDLIKTVPNQSLDRMKELVYENYMKGNDYNQYCKRDSAAIRNE